jgi:hypothetical protein
VPDFTSDLSNLPTNPFRLLRATWRRPKLPYGREEMRMKMYLNSTLYVCHFTAALTTPNFSTLVSNFGQSSESRLSKNTFSGRAGLLFVWRRNDFRTLGKHILRKDEREIWRGPNPAPQANDNDPQTTGICRHAPTVPQPSPYALRGEGAADPRAPFARISFGRSRMGIRQLVETKANHECCGALRTASATSV